jgi:hypothetical protein
MIRLYHTAEVEAALHTHPAVKQAAVFGVDDEILGQMVHATVVLRPGRPGLSASPALTQQELIAHARQLLSAYKVGIGHSSLVTPHSNVRVPYARLRLVRRCCVACDGACSTLTHSQ